MHRTYKFGNGTLNWPKLQQTHIESKYTEIETESEIFQHTENAAVHKHSNNMPLFGWLWFFGILRVHVYRQFV